MGGEKIGLPFFPAPTAGQRMFHNEGELATAAAAAGRRVPFCLSTFATRSFEEVAAAQRGALAEGVAGVAAERLPPGPSPPPKVFQLYVLRDRGLVGGLLEGAAAAGFRHVVLTADLTWFGNRERDRRTGLTVPPTYSPRQVFGAALRPAWSFDFAANDEYRYALMAPETEAGAMSAFLNGMIDPRFDWDDARYVVTR